MSVLDAPIHPFTEVELQETLRKESDDFPKFLGDGYVTLNYDGVEYYYIELDRIKTPLDLLAWVNQISGKTWMTPARTKQFIRSMCTRNGWSLDLPA